ncbi:hypothetical protein [Williamsia sp.]|uniref:hypothetical protein n=1 Tax=Williamsia sp. TaxID=1872085 RepID=UPI002F9466DF
MIRVDFPAPVELRPRWAAFAATLAGMGPRWARGAYATPTTWHYDDGGGNWADLQLVDGGRAVLVGHDHEYSETYFGHAAEYFGQTPTDLLAGTPQWWSPVITAHLERIDTEGMWVGFIYGFDGRTWNRADYDADDGFTSLNVPFGSDAQCAELINEHLTGAAESPPVDTAAVAALVAAGPAVARATLESVFDGGALDVDAALAAARSFAPRLEGSHPA